MSIKNNKNLCIYELCFYVKNLINNLRLIKIHIIEVIINDVDFYPFISFVTFLLYCLQLNEVNISFYLTKCQSNPSLTSSIISNEITFSLLKNTDGIVKKAYYRTENRK